MPFDRAAALAAVEACQRAYDRPNIWGVNGQGHVDLDAPGGAAVAVAGTNAKRDVLQDAQFWKKDIGQGRDVHAGFWHHFKGLEMPLTEKAFLPAILAGHSLGAAVAVLMVAIYPSRFAGSDVYLFGCPFVGNVNFAAIFEADCLRLNITVWRIVSKGDLVAELNLPGDWQHVGRQILFGRGGDLEPDHRLAAYRAALEAML